MKRTKGTKETSYNDNDMIKIALEIFRTDAFLAINKKLIKVLGLEKALFISNLIDKYKYFQKREMLTEDGAFYNTHEDQIYEIGLTEYQIRKCKKELIKMGILKTEKRGVPAKEFYFINFQLLIAMVFGEELNIEGLDLTKTEGLDLTKTEGLDLTKTEGLDLTKTEGLYNKTKDNKTKDNKNLFSDLNLKEGKQDKNSRYVPLAERLASIIRKNKRINVTSQRIASWANEIRKLVETDGVSIQRVETALNWYEENIGGQYVPVIESGFSLRSKFIKLEDAMRRAGVTPGQPKTSPTDTPKDPKKVLQQFFRSKDLAHVFYRDCYEPAEALFEGTVDERTLAETLLNLYSQIKEKQEQNLSGDLVRLLPGPMELIARYVDWIRDNSWITNIRLDMFDLNHTLFSKFRRDEAKTDNFERDAITGKSYLRG